MAALSGWRSPGPARVFLITWIIVSRASSPWSCNSRKECGLLLVARWPPTWVCGPSWFPRGPQFGLRFGFSFLSVIVAFPKTERLCA